MKFYHFLFLSILLMFGTICFNSCCDPADSTGPLNNPPAQASSPVPADGATDQPIDAGLDWESYDADDDSLTFDIYFGDANPPPLVVEEKATSGYDPVDLVYSQTYFWKIDISDGQAVTEGEIWSFATVANQPPEPPSNPVPADNAADQAMDLSLTWSCDDPEDDALVYEVYFGTDSNPPLVEENLDTTAYEVAGLDPSTVYYWKITAKDGFDNVTEGNVWSFTTGAGAPQAPAVPSNPTPADNALDQAPEQILAWSCSDPNNDPLTYNVYFGTDENPPLVAEGRSQTTYETERLEYEQTYYWRITAEDDDGNATDGPVWSFTIDENQAPDAPSNPSPPDEATDQQLTVILKWTGSDLYGDSLIYDVYFGDTEDPEVVSLGQVDTSYAPAGLEHDSTYYWKIIAKDEGGLTAESPVWSFTARPPDNRPPGAPYDPAPADSVIDMPVDTVLSWSCIDPDGDPLTYDVYLGTTDNPGVVRRRQSETTYDPPNLRYNETYYWKIVARDDHNHSTESPLWSFNTLRANIVIVESNPVGASIYLDGVNMQLATPDTLVDVMPGDHSVRLYLDGRNEYNEDFTLEQNEIQQIEADLTEPGWPRPHFVIAQPADGASFNDNVIEVVGTVDLRDEQGANPTPYDGGKVIMSLNGVDQEAAVDNGAFSQEISLAGGQNTIRMRGTSAGGYTGVSDLITVTGAFNVPDIEIIAAWNTPTSDIDLHVWNPQGQHCYYNRRFITEGSLDLDDTEGYGPEVFTAENALAGTYIIKLNCYDLDDDPYSDVSVQLRLYGETRSFFGPHRFTVADRNGNVAEAWWEVTTFEMGNGLFDLKAQPLSPEMIEQVKRDMRNLPAK